MILLGNCPLCSGSNLLKKFDCIDHSTSKEKFTIVSCETCEFTFTNPRPKDNSLGEYYESDMYISHTNNNKGLFNWMYHTVRKYAIGTKLNLLKRTSKNKNHLDIGCGTGEFLNACKKFNPVILDQTNKSAVIQITALRREIDKMTKNLKSHGLISVSRTGAVAMTRGAEIFN